MNRKEILEQTVKTVCTDRNNQYGSPEDNFNLIKDLWQTYLHIVIKKKDGYLEPVDVAMMMSLLKIARIATGKHKDDNFIDLAGYAACGGELSASKAPKTSEDNIECNVDDYNITDKDYIAKLSTTVSNLTEELENTKEQLKTAKRDLEVLDDNYQHEVSYLKERNEELLLNEGSLLIEIATLKSEKKRPESDDIRSCNNCRYDDKDMNSEPCISCSRCYTDSWEPKK